MSFTVGSPLPVQSCTNISTVDDDNVEGDQDIVVSIMSAGLPVSVSTLLPSQQSAIFLDNDGMEVCIIETHIYRLYKLLLFKEDLNICWSLLHFNLEITDYISTCYLLLHFSC